MKWSPQNLELLKHTVAKNLTDDEFFLFTEICKRRGLDPFSKQIYAVKRGGTLTIQTAIDGYRLIADRSGRYAGQVGPFWCSPDGKWADVWATKANPWAAKIGVLKIGFLEPVWGVAYWDMYVGDGPFWKKAGPHMLAKVAEALALKKAFPEELSGLYTDDEMDQAQSSGQVITMQAPQPSTPQSAVVFPSSVRSKWADPKGVEYRVVLDQAGEEWLFSGGDTVEQVETAIGTGGGLLVTYMFDTGRKVVTEVAPS